VGYPAVPLPTPLPEVVDPVVEFMRGVPPPPLLMLRADDVPQTFEGLRQLASCWNWSEVVRLSEHCAGTHPALPHQRLQWRFAQAFALAKLNFVAEATDLLEKTVLRFPEEQNSYEAYPSVYPGKRGSMVPFALRLLHARLPLLRSEPKPAQVRLYDLLHFCQQQRQRAAAAGSPAGSPQSCGAPTLEEGLKADPDAVESWLARERRVKLELVGIHAQQFQHNCALTLLNEVLAAYTPDVRRSLPRGQLEYADLLQRLGSLHLDAGQLGPAEDAFSRVEAIDESALSPEEQRQLEAAVAVGRARLSMAQQQYGKAFEEFAAALAKDPGNVEVANNQAVCALCSCHLTEAVAILEGLIRADPAKALTEPVVFNLCSLYDLQSEQGTQRKRVLQAVVHRYKGPHFPAKYLRMSDDARPPPAP